MNRKNVNFANTGFTLVELLVVISIIAIIIGTTMSNLLGARGRARDSVRKSNLMELKNALRLYYNDYQTYPASDNTGTGMQIMGCGGPVNPNPPGRSLCPSTCTDEFAAGPTGCDTVYMKRLPRSPSGSGFEYRYYRVASGDDFCMTITLENAADTGIAASQAKCATACTAASVALNPTDYVMCAD
jgi:prepilin-type N-terminal cleavage/methylation domain-containing protein